MKRAADQGMGHLKPSEALAWCKAEAKAEADAQTKGEYREPSIESASSNSESDEGLGTQSDAQSDMEDEHPLPGLGKIQDDNKDDTRMGSRVNTASNGLFSMPKAQHMGLVDEAPDEVGRNFKRPADSQWLKGSYASKRAKWNSPAAASPTPMPDAHLERDRRRRQESTRPLMLNGNATLLPSPTTPWSHYAQERTNLNTCWRGTNYQSSYPHSDMSTTKKIPPATSGAAGDEEGGLNHHREDMLYEGSRETTFISAVSHLDRRIIQDKMSLTLHQPIHPPETCDISIPTIAEHLAPGMANLDRSGPSSLPTTLHTYAGSNADSEEDFSFVTEIAPSSRDLEHFQYRKKRRRSNRGESTGSAISHKDQMEVTPHSSPESVTPDSDELSSILKEKVGSIHEPEGNLIVDTNILHDLPESPGIAAPQNRPSSQLSKSPIPAPCSNPSLLPSEELLEDSVTRNQTYSDSSWDMMDDIDMPEITICADLSKNGNQVPTQSFPYGQEDGHTSSIDGNLPEHKNLGIESVAIDLSQELIPTSQGATKGLNARQTEEIYLGQDPADESTQSYNTTPSGSSRTPYKRTLTSSNLSKIVERCFEVGNPPTDTVPLAQDLQIVAGVSDLPLALDGLSQEKDGDQFNIETVDTGGNQVASARDKLDPMEIIQEALSQDCGTSSRTSSQNTSNNEETSPKDSSLRKEGGAPIAIARSDSPHIENQPSWQRDAPQSPWAATTDAVKVQASCESPESEYSHTPVPREAANMEKPPGSGGASESVAGWQQVELPKTPEHDEIIPIRKFLSPTPSPEPTEPRSVERGLLSTQALLEATTGNPWTSSFRNPASGKSKKRVSFGNLPFEETESSTETPVSRQVPGSPPLPRSVKYLREEDDFDDNGTTKVNQFEKHFLTVGGVNRVLSDTGNSQKSPGVGAMAEAFIAADRDTSTKTKARCASQESPSRHLRPMSEAMANINSPELDHLSPISSPSGRQNMEPAGSLKTIDYDMDDELGDFIGGAGGFLEEWSVEAELKKVEPSKSTKSSRDSTGRSSMFGFTSRW